MAGASLLTLLDDIASVLDDVATMTKLATKKTAGVLGDDLALNAQQVSGVRADRELPVVWNVAIGSLKNKAILVPAALAISAVVPWAVSPLLMIGGLFLCYEGFDEIWHRPTNREEKHREALHQAVLDPAVDLRDLERDKIKGAIRTDFILSAEIIVISLGSVATATFTVRVAALIAVALLMTVGVYGFVAGIVKLDDFGVYLCRRPADGTTTRVLRWLGQSILSLAPWLMKLLSIAGTAAMFLVGGGIIVHGIPAIEHWLEHLRSAGSGFLAAAAPMLLGAVVGVLAGAVTLLIVSLLRKLWPGESAASESR